MNRGVLVFLVGWAIAMAGCGGGGGGGSGTSGGGSCSTKLPTDRLCELSCTDGSRSTVAQVLSVLDVPSSMIALAPLEYGGGKYQMFLYHCDDVGTNDSYDYDFWFTDTGRLLALIHAEGTGKFAYGASEDRVTLPACAAACNYLPAP